MDTDTKGISIITCSVNPELCKQMIESIKNTIGTDFETIVFDNREEKMEICQVYNNCAQKAKFPYLCFIHEDTVMGSPNWGVDMIAFSERTANCGAIGFLGGTLVEKNFICWSRITRGRRFRYYGTEYGNKTSTINDLRYKSINPEKEEFAKVITLDGLFLFVKKDIWNVNQFDEENIKGFHFYDADFSFRTSQKLQNYVCLTADIYHFSGGSQDKIYYENARIFQKLWKKSLPRTINKQKISIFDEINSGIDLIFGSIRNGLTIKSSIKHFIEINDFFYFFIACILMSLRIVKAIMRRMLTKLKTFKK